MEEETLQTVKLNEFISLIRKDDQVIVPTENLRSAIDVLYQEAQSLQKQAAQLLTQAQQRARHAEQLKTLLPAEGEEPHKGNANGEAPASK